MIEPTTGGITAPSILKNMGKLMKILVDIYQIKSG